MRIQLNFILQDWLVSDRRETGHASSQHSNWQATTF